MRSAAGLIGTISPLKPALCRFATISKPTLPGVRDAPITATDSGYMSGFNIYSRLRAARAWGSPVIVPDRVSRTEGPIACGLPRTARGGAGWGHCDSRASGTSCARW
jgi:hypothetical protein